MSGKESIKKTFIISEIGVNHNGSLSLAKKMVDEAKAIGVDAVKFQVFIPEDMICSNHEHFSMLKRLALSNDDFKNLFEYCKKVDIKFLATPFDLDSIDFLNELGMEVFKIPSGEITNYPYLYKIGQLKKKIIISTGMANIAEIKDALEVLINNGTKKENVTILQCTTSYPALFEELNLKVIKTLKDEFNLDVGFSDHSLGIEASVSAVALGACVIEKHFTLDKDMDGPDHKASLDKAEFANLVKSIRNIEKALGHGVKEVTSKEKEYLDIARKSIVAGRDISVGEVFKEENLAVKRPGSGINPMLWNDVIGRQSKKVFKQDEMIEI